MLTRRIVLAPEGAPRPERSRRGLFCSGGVFVASPALAKPARTGHPQVCSWIRALGRATRPVAVVENQDRPARQQTVLKVVRVRNARRGGRIAIVV